MRQAVSRPKRLVIPIKFDAMADAALVRIGQFVASENTPTPVIPCSKSTWWRLVKAGKAPQPIKLSSGITAWRVGDLRTWLAGKASS